MFFKKGFPIGLKLVSCVALWAFWLCQPATTLGGKSSPLSGHITSQDALLVADPEGRIIYKVNETIKFTPASTLKLLTALTAIHHLGRSYRFKTEVYQDADQNLKIKGYGDPTLISEVWQKIADALVVRLREFNNLLLDDSYFASNLQIPGVGISTNPYDALNGALCANFLKRDKKGRIVSA